MDSSSIFWLLPLSRVILSFICDGFVSCWLPFVAEQIPIMPGDHDLFIRSPCWWTFGLFPAFGPDQGGCRELSCGDLCVDTCYRFFWVNTSV